MVVQAALQIQQPWSVQLVLVLPLQQQLAPRPQSAEPEPEPAPVPVLRRRLQPVAWSQPSSPAEGTNIDNEAPPQWVALPEQLVPVHMGSSTKHTAPPQQNAPTEPEAVEPHNVPPAQEQHTRMLALRRSAPMAAAERIQGAPRGDNSAQRRKDNHRGQAVEGMNMHKGQQAAVCGVFARGARARGGKRGHNRPRSALWAPPSRW